MHLIGIEDQTFDFTVIPTRVDVLCNGANSLAAVERVFVEGGYTHRFWYSGKMHDGYNSIDEAVDALKRMHVEAKLLESAVEAIGKYVADSSAKLFGEDE